MKILIFAGYFYPHKGGLEDHIQQFAEHLSKNHKVSILTTNTLGSSDQETLNKNLEIYRMNCWDVLNQTYPIFIPNKKFFKTWKKLKKQKWDIIMTRTRFFTTSFLGLVFSKQTKTPLIHVEHGSCHIVHNSKFVEIVNRIYDHTIGYSIVKNARINVGISKGAQEFLKHLRAEEPFLIHRGIGLENIPKYTPKKQVKNIIFVGRLIYAKGVQDLIEAFSKINNPHLKLTIVGDGPYKKDLKTLAQKLNLEKNVIFTGEKNKKEVFSLLSKSDLFVNSSYSEGLPTSVLEAGAVGLPVIATDVGGTNEVIINKKTGILIKPRNPTQLREAIDFIMKNAKKRGDYSKSLTKQIKNKFNWQKTIKQWESILKEVS